MNPVIYYRPGPDVSEEEVQSMHKHFKCINSRLKIQTGDLVIPRYSALPFYKELQEDIEAMGAQIINTYKQHRYVADLGNWVNDFEGLTPKTWNRLELVPENEFPIIIKGETNSKKFSWDTHMYCADRSAAVQVSSRLFEDGLIGSQQNLYFRKFIPLHTYLIGLRGLPITKEFRVFVCDNEILSIGYYWSNYLEDLDVKPNISEVPKEFLQQIIDRVDGKIPFFVVDVAQTAEGNWIVIELNDGQMSGLGAMDKDPERLYSTLAQVLSQR